MFFFFPFPFFLFPEAGALRKIQKTAEQCKIARTHVLAHVTLVLSHKTVAASADIRLEKCKGNVEGKTARSCCCSKPCSHPAEAWTAALSAWISSLFLPIHVNHGPGWTILGQGGRERSRNKKHCLQNSSVLCHWIA